MVRRNESRPEWPEGPRGLEWLRAVLPSCRPTLVRAQMMGSQPVISSRYQWAQGTTRSHMHKSIRRNKNKSFKMKYVGGDKCVSRKKLEPLFTVVGMQHGTAPMENSMGVPQKIESKKSCDPAIPLWGIYPKELNQDLKVILMQYSQHYSQ